MDGTLNRVFKKRVSLNNPSSCKVHFFGIQDIVAGQNTPRPVIVGLQTNYQAISDVWRRDQPALSARQGQRRSGDPQVSSETGNLAGLGEL